MKNTASNTCLIAVATLFVSFAGTAAAGERVQVKFTDGMTIVAELDERTNEDRLVLRFATETTVLLRSVAWTRVVSIAPIATSKDFVPKAFQNKIRAVSNVAKRSYAKLATEALANPATGDKI